jgi:HSP20 family molecular chaperone IbpA
VARGRSTRKSPRSSSIASSADITRSARTFALPPTVDAGKVSAQYKAGVLTVRLPLREENKAKQIKVEVAA